MKTFCFSEKIYTFSEDPGSMPGNMTFGEMSSLYDDKGVPKKVFQLLPQGTVKVTDDATSEIVEIPFTEDILAELEQNYRENARGQKIPIEIDHKDSGAYGWLDAVNYNPSVGLFVTPNYNPDGISLLEGKKYGYASAEIIKNYTNSITGKQYRYVLSGVSLTNRPKIKMITAILEGFSEGFSEGSEEKKTRSLNEILSQLNSIAEELKGHPELYRKPGSPQAKVLLKTALQNIEKYITKEDLSMNENGKKETNQEKPAVSGITLSELNKILEEERKKTELTFSEKLAEKVTEIEKSAQEKVMLAEQRAEQRVHLIEEKLHDKEDELVLSEAIRGKDGKGRILPQDKEKWAKKLKKARAVGVVKLSEGVTYDDYAETVKELRNLTPVIEYNSEYGSSELSEGGTAEWKDVLKLSEQKMKENPNLTMHQAKNLAIIETGYQFVKSVRK